jgi:hypothetical protein
MAAILSVTPVAQGPGFWARQFGPNRTGGQDAFDVIFGLILPILCFMADPVVFKSLAIFGRPLFEDYQLFAYVVSTVEMGCFLVWRTFPSKVNTLSPLFGGVFLIGACVSGWIGLAMLPLTLPALLFVIGFLGLIPFLTAFVYLRTGIRAMNAQANAAPLASRITVTSLSGFVAIGSLVVACTFAENAISASVDTVIYGNTAAAEAAVKRLKWFRFVPAKQTNRLALAYSREWNDEKRAVLARAYWELTGDDVDRWSRMLVD